MQNIVGGASKDAELVLKCDHDYIKICISIRRDFLAYFNIMTTTQDIILCAMFTEAWILYFLFLIEAECSHV